MSGKRDVVVSVMAAVVFICLAIMLLAQSVPVINIFGAACFIVLAYMVLWA